MMSRIRIFPYRQGSRSANLLARALGGRVLRLVESSFNPTANDVIINWGNSDCTICTVNASGAIAIASNKRNAFAAMKAAGVRVPRFTTDQSKIDWNGMTVVRHKLTGHSGEGIELVEDGAEMPAAPLYVEYIKKQDEYRIHVIGDQVVAIQRKAARRDYEGRPDFRVRNHRNGFVFVRNTPEGERISPPEQVLAQSKAAIKALGLDFGAVDVVWNEHSQTAYVLEVNTAPGLEGQTINDYAEGFKSFLGLGTPD